MIQWPRRAGAKEALGRVLQAGKRSGTQLVGQTRRGYALTWRLGYRAYTMFSALTTRWGGKIWVVLFFVISCAAVALAPAWEWRLRSLGDRDHLPALQQLLGSLGGALLGATAIAFSLVMFAMQVNVERLPYGLFRKFGSDRRLLFSFVVTFMLAIGIACLSLFVEQIGVARSLALTAVGAALTLTLFLYAYQRALALISPHEQLRIVRQAATANLQRWVARAKRMAPLLLPAMPEEAERLGHGPQIDRARMEFFMRNPRWTAEAFEALNYCIAFARRFAERGDHEVAGIALTVVVAINKSYVEAKGRTFMADTYFFDNPLTSDGFLNHTLEQLRQNVQVGISKRDERQIQDTYRTFAALVQVYLQIAYAGDTGAKTHAYLAAGYLASGVKATATHDLPDVLMEGLRLIGAVSRLQVALAEPRSATNGSESIAQMALVGISRPNQLAVTSCGTEQLSQLVLSLLQYVGKHNPRFAIAQVRGDAFNLATTVVDHLGDAPLSPSHRNALAPYFSVTGTLVPGIRTLANAISNEPADNRKAARVISNIVHWTDGLYQPYKELLLAAIDKHSSLTHELIAWAGEIFQVLLDLSWAPACDQHDRDKLRRSASRLISTWSWIPDDRQTVAYVECHSLADMLFSAALDAHRRDCEDIAGVVFKLLMGWAFKSGRYETGWASLEIALCGAAALCGLGVVSEDELMKAIDGPVCGPNAPTPEIRFRTADRINEAAGSLSPYGRGHSDIDSALGNLDAEVLGPLLGRVAKRLIPEAGIGNSGTG